MNIEKYRNEYKRVASQGQNTNFLDNIVKMPEGEGAITVRLLPPGDDGELFCASRVHHLNDKNIHCHQVLVDGKWEGTCPVCDYYRKLWKDSDRADSIDTKNALQSEAREIKPIERYYYNVIVRDANGNVGPKILAIGKQIHLIILRGMFGDPSVDEPELGDVTDRDGGYDFKIIKKITKSGPNSFPNYEQSRFMHKPSKLGTAEEIKKWMGSLHDLKSLRRLISLEEMIKELNIFKGLEDDPDTSMNKYVTKPKEEVVVENKSAAKPKITSNLVKDEEEVLVGEEFYDTLDKLGL